MIAGNLKQCKKAASFILKLRKIVSKQTINEELTSHSYSVLCSRISEALGKAGICISDIEGLNEAFNGIPPVFEGQYKQEKGKDLLYHVSLPGK